MRVLSLSLVACGCLALAGCGHESAASNLDVPVVAVAAPAVAAAPAPVPQTVAQAAPSESPTPPAPPARGKKPPADRAPSRPGEAEKITFDDLNLGMQADMVFRPFLLTDRVKELDGKRISILGFIHGAADRKKAKEFVLLKNTECKFGKDGQADHLAMVYLAAGKTTDFTTEAVKVEGTLKIKPYQGADGNTWSVYDLEQAQVVR